MLESKTLPYPAEFNFEFIKKNIFELIEMFPNSRIQNHAYYKIELCT